MTNLYQGVAVLALIGVVILAFGMSAMIRLIDGLKRDIRYMQPLHPSPTMDHLVKDGRRTAVLAVDYACSGSKIRAQELAYADNAVILANDQRCREWVSNEQIPLVVSADLLEQLNVRATPSLLIVDPDGSLSCQHVIGSRDDLMNHIDLHFNDFGRSQGRPRGNRGASYDRDKIR